MENVGLTQGVQPSMDSPLSKIYKGRTVLVTGHTGFKGSWLSLWLRRLGAVVVGYALSPPTHPNLFEAIGLAQDMVHIQADVRDAKRLTDTLAKYQPEIVFHLASQALVRHSYADPRGTYETNVMGTVNLLEAARKTSSVRALVVITSDKCYENRDWVWGYREDDPMGGHDPYSSSKGCCELVASSYLRSYFPPEQYGITHQVAMATARAGNVIGGGDWAEGRLVPDCIRALSGGNEILLRNPDAIRPWQYVLDPLAGYLLLGALLQRDGPRYSGGWNFGSSSDEEWHVVEVAQEVIRLWGKGALRVKPSDGTKEAHWLKLDCSKARRYLGWRPHFSIKEALSLSVDWYRRYYSAISRKVIHDLTLDHIARYSAW